MSSFAEQAIILSRPIVEILSTHSDSGLTRNEIVQALEKKLLPPMKKPLQDAIVQILVAHKSKSFVEIADEILAELTPMWPEDGLFIDYGVVDCTLNYLIGQGAVRTLSLPNQSVRFFPSSYS